jgi:hypothetical protein
VNAPSAVPDPIEGTLEIPGRKESVLSEVRRRQIQDFGTGAIPVARGAVAGLTPKQVGLVSRDGATGKLRRVCQSWKVIQGLAESILVEDGHDIGHVGVVWIPFRSLCPKVGP